MSKSKAIKIREVWSHNLLPEFQLIRHLINYYPYISMDTEFPGVIFKPSPADFKKSTPADHYKFLKANVDALNLIQLGLTLSDSDGNLPDLGGDYQFIWQFNFCDFDPARHPHAPDSIELLTRQGIDFDKNRVCGIHSGLFAQFMIRFGLVWNSNLTWVTFQSAYDFAYLVKILTHRPLPNCLNGFLAVTRTLFGEKAYDVKHLMKFCDTLYGGLESVSKTLQAKREVGNCHQAGSDSLLTWHAFQKIRDSYFSEDGGAKHAGVLFGLELCCWRRYMI